MKKKQRAKSKRIAVLAVLVLILMLSGCKNMFNPPNLGNNIQAGMGNFTLHIEGAGSQSRVIMPVTDTLVFAGYTLVFTDTTSVLPPQTFYLSETDKGNPVALEAGTYDLNVTAYTAYTSASINTPAAKGELKNIVIPAGGGVGGTVTLNAIFNEGGNGTFSWDLTFSSKISEAWMEISSQADVTFTPVTSYFVTADTMKTPVSNPGDMALPSGNYRVNFTLEEDSSHKQIIWRETLHVYENLTSHFEHDFTDYIFIKQSYTVTLSNLYDSLGNPATDEISTYFYDDVIENPERNLYLFEGWYTDGLFQTIWNGIISGDITLYANWTGYPVISLSTDTVDFGVIKEGTPVPSEQAITITNSGSASANVTVAFSSGGASFTLIDTPVAAVAANNGSEIFKVKPNNSLSIGTYNAVISVTEGSNLLTIAVTFTVQAKYSGFDRAYINLNSNSLLDIPSARYGWYAKTLNEGIWLSGQMVQIGENQQLSINVPGINFPFNGFDSNRLSYDGAGLAGGVGDWARTSFRSGSNVCNYIETNIYIPHDSVDVYLEGNNNPATIIHRGNNLVHTCNLPDSLVGGTNDQPAKRALCHYISGLPGNVDLQLKIDIEAYASFEYENATEIFVANPYPIFLQGGIYYWQINNCGDPSCLIKGNDHVQDLWSIASEKVTIVDFTPGPHNATTPPIKIRAWDASEPGVTFEEASPAYQTANGIDGLDIDLPPLTPSHYLAPASFDIIIDNEIVGEALIRVIGHVQDSTTLILSQVTLEVEYNLDPVFASYVDEYTCNDIPVPGSGIVEITRNHGNITLYTDFTFY